MTKDRDDVSPQPGTRRRMQMSPEKNYTDARAYPVKNSKAETKRVTMSPWFNSTKLMVLMVLCLQNSLYTLLRRYSQGVLKEKYSKVRSALFVASAAMVFIGSIGTERKFLMIATAQESRNKKQPVPFLFFKQRISYRSG